MRAASREDNALAKTLIIEVSFDTDPNSPHHDPSALREMNRVAQEASQKTAMFITHLRVVPKTPSSATTRMASPSALPLLLTRRREPHSRLFNASNVSRSPNKVRRPSESLT